MRRSEAGGWWVEIPDLPGCFGEGSTLEEAVLSIHDGLDTHLAALVEYGLPIPPATPLAEFPDIPGARITFVYASTDNATLGEPSVSAAEAARMLGVSPGRVSQLLREGRLTGQRTPIGTQVTAASVEAYREARRSPGRPRKAAEA